MIELYHWEPNGASGRAMICLKEKGIDFTSRYVDVLAFQQHQPPFLALHETGEVPVLVRDGDAYWESSYLCEYLDEAFPDNPLMPKEPLARWEVRAWQKYVDDFVAASVGDLAWAAYGAKALKGRDRAEIETAIARIPMKERRDIWQAALAGLSETQLASSRERIKKAVEKMEADLRSSGWLAGGAFSLADVAAFPFVNYLPRLTPEIVNEQVSPRTLAWLGRVAERPAVKAALAMARTADPFAIAAPGSEHVRWG